jgi:hypothetical protein
MNFGIAYVLPALSIELISVPKSNTIYNAAISFVSSCLLIPRAKYMTSIDPMILGYIPVDARKGTNGKRNVVIISYLQYRLCAR